MIKKTLPSKDKIETDVILVIKGAGEQREDEHLSQFLRGFWPAITALDGNATIDQVTDGLKDYSPAPHNKEGDLHKHLTEIHATYQGVQRRVWVKESYWESEVLPSTALSNLSKEWRISSFAFSNLFRDHIFSRNTRKLKEWRQSKDLQLQLNEFYHGSAPGTRIVDYISRYLAPLLLFSLTLLPFASILSSHILPLLAPTLDSGSWINGILFTLAVAAVWALAPAAESSRIIMQGYKGRPRRDLPGLPGWLLIALILLLISRPLGYINFLLLLLALQFTLLLARRILWKYRQFANSDVDIADYYSYETESRSEGKGPEKHIGKVDEPWLTRFFLSPFLYRYFVLLTLPIGFVGTVLVRILKWTRILGVFGDALDGVLNTALVGYLDDVVDYAMDPAQAHRVRSAVKHDIIYFDKRADVTRIHIIAHSQGTPITYETLFHFLEPKCQKKIYTYVTIGSVLSYYHQARGILDPVYYERFPVGREKEQGFPPQFKWMNFWNFTDPITEFYGLDEYTWFEDAPPVDKSYKRTRTSPTNIRSHTSLKNHGEYWDNVDQINTPFAKRVLGESKPKEWDPEPINPKSWHHTGVFLLSLLMILILAALGFGIYSLATSESLGLLSTYFSAIQANLQGAFCNFQELFFSAACNEPNMLQKFVDFFTSEQLKTLWWQVLDVSFLVLAAIAVFDWLSQLVRAYNIGRE